MRPFIVNKNQGILILDASDPCKKKFTFILFKASFRKRS